MPESKYARLFVTDMLKRGGEFPLYVANGTPHFDGAPFSLRLHYVTFSHRLIPIPHKHEFDQFLFFLPCDMSKPKDFNAEVELTIGEEGEVHVITSPTAIRMPAGTVHGPLFFKTVTRPIMLIDIPLIAQYTRKESPR